MVQDINVNYTSHFVAFIDVLGFSNLVERSTSDENAKDQVRNFYRSIHHTFSDFKRIQSKSTIFTIAVSDTIIFAVPVKAINNNEVDTLREICLAAGRIQYGMARNHLWLRGGIARGPCWVDEEKNLVVGPAYLRAYHLEDKVARYPRIILDTEIINALEFKTKTDFIEALNKLPQELIHANWETDCLFNWRRTQVDMCGPLEEDFPLFVDYLSPLKLAGNEDATKIVIQNVEHDLYSNVDYEKMRWMVKYLLTLFGARMRDNEFDVDFSETIEHLGRL